MSEWPKAGEKMKFLNKNGYPMDLAEAQKHFTEGQVLTVKDFHLGNWNSTILFEENKKWFNSVMFEPASQPK